MKPVARIGSLCTATMSPYGPAAFGVVYGRIISGAGQIFVNGKPIAVIGSEIAYAGFVYEWGNIQYRSWIGRVTTGSPHLANGRPIATIGSNTDSAGNVLDGEFQILA